MLASHENKFQFRAAKASEASLIRDFFISILSESFPMFSAEAMQAYTSSWNEEKLVARIERKSDLLILAWDNEVPVGLVSGSAPEGGVGTVIWLLVAAGCRGQNLGSQLLQHACEYYRSLGCHKLKLTAPSEKARDFYVKQGMIVEGFHPSHWWQADYWSLGLDLGIPT